MSFKLTPKQAGYIRPIAGTIVLIIGLVSMFLPFLPLGYLFSLGGIFLLAPYIPFLRRFLSFMERKDDKGRVKKATEKVSEKEKKVERKVTANEDD
ncbi:MAG: hypothetical protein ACOC12_04630 [Bacteroidota bacterium]